MNNGTINGGEFIYEYNDQPLNPFEYYIDLKTQLIGKVYYINDNGDISGSDRIYKSYGGRQNSQIKRLCATNNKIIQSLNKNQMRLIYAVKQGV